MPKSQYVDPNRAFDSGFIRFHDIPVCQYNLTIEDEKRIYSKQDLINIYRDMAIIREFETMLNEIKTKSVYNGVEYNNPGPAHLSLGQEASAVGQAYCLDNNDFTFGSHRSHGEIIAKGLSSIKKLDNTELYDIMKTFLDGSILSVVEGKEEVKGDVRMENVSFGYLKDRIVLHNLNLKADAGKTIAIVGPTGAGKTTIINLLMRFYDVNDGNIYVDDHETRTLTRKSLRRSYAMVLQDTWLFEGTIYDNIAYGKQGATKDEVIAAAKAAHIHSFIMQLPDGYDTIIHEDGGNISKGQKQLLTIARAMLYDTNMLILDEATSNVDTNTEKEVQKAMRNLMKDKTCFVIAHRLSTIQNADLILVREHGDVVEQGTHESLMKAHKNYYRLYASQFE